MNNFFKCNLAPKTGNTPKTHQEKANCFTLQFHPNTSFTVPGIRGEVMKENKEWGEFKHDILDTF
jgi:hypothetical protein